MVQCGGLRLVGSESVKGLNHAGGGGVAIARGGDPIGVAREEGEPIGGGAADDDAVDGVLEALDSGLRRRGGVEVELDELSVAGFGGAVAVVGD